MASKQQLRQVHKASTASRRTADFVFENHGSIWLVQAMNAEAREHIASHVSDEAQFFSGALVVEPRYVENLALGLSNEGYLIQF